MTTRKTRTTNTTSTTKPDGFTIGVGFRKTYPRTELAKWDPSLRTRDPLQILKSAEGERLPELMPLKYQRMSASPFGFFRGAAPVMAYDLSLSANTGVITQLCGDAHVQNLGAYSGPDGRLVFDINDFDETVRGPFEWDIKRMATSMLLAGNDAGVRKTACNAAAAVFLTSYCDLMRQLAGMPILEVARYQVHRLGSIAPISKILLNAQRATPVHTLERLTEPYKTKRRFRSQPPLLRRVTGNEAQAVLASLIGFRQSLIPARQHFFGQFTPVDIAFKVVGTGSVGLRDYVIYMAGNGPGDPLFLQIKQEAASVYAEYLRKHTELRENQGQRTAEGQQAMQFQSDPLLGWTTLDGRDYLVRQLNDHKASVDITGLKASDLSQYAAVCGEILARGHARAGDARIIAGYIGGGKRFTAAILEFAALYAAQSVSDWKLLVSQPKLT
ncbi:DUF2252 domain-containing protein [Granulicella sibirica]|uniref:DUF2252 domain-containing protein n=1 Tax=Granulicella sibirica TaxID=2479048 RepID=A0A4Q0T5M7_9BACT|nr:DUF2252 domain-containing protein [Granulicella sibirica]RXH57930.1 hypothetical protein GRAN_1240 [Granulicella sibirica]